MTTTHPPTTAERAAARAARIARLSADLQQIGAGERNAAETVDAALTLADRLSSVTGPTLALIRAEAVRASLRLPSVVADPDDVCAETLLRLARSDAGTVALMTVGQGSGSALALVRRAVRQSVQSAAERSDGRRSLTEDDAEREQSEARAAALENDGPVAQIDRDGARSFIADVARFDTAQHHAGEPRSVRAEADKQSRGTAYKRTRRISERTTASAVHLVREANLETLLAQTLRVHHHTDSDAPQTSGRTLSGLLSDRESAATWSAAFNADLNGAASEQRNAVGRAVAALSSLSSLDLWYSARWYGAEATAALADAQSAAQSAATVRAAVRAGQADRTAATSAATAARAATDRSDRSSALAALAWSAYVIVRDGRDGRTLTLADLVWASLTVSAGAGDSRRSLERRSAADHSLWDRQSVLAYLGLPVDANGRSARALGALVADAATAALDAVTGSAPASLALALRRRGALRADRSGLTAPAVAPVAPVAPAAPLVSAPPAALVGALLIGRLIRSGR